MVIIKTSVCIFICIRCCWNECSQYVLHLFKAESMSLFLGLKHLWSPSLSQTHLLCLVTMVTSLHTADLIIYRTTPLWEMPNHIYILWLVSFCQGEECSWCHVVLLHSYDIFCSFSVCKKSKSKKQLLKNNQIYFSLIFQQLCIFQNIHWQLNST